ncbi:MAG: hypothetical protein M1838_001018 [Thelocarpon superellum]|nr:MAG: hypothetical protein M1838_001018 [Thelocarpon superellum]
MVLGADDETALKKWIVKRLEDVSDADSDVLADYVLALLRNDSPADELRQLCIESLEDFLKDHTAAFVDDTLRAVANKLYLPRAAPSSFASSGPAPALVAPDQGPRLSKKRSYNDQAGNDTRDERDPHYGNRAGGDRAIKQMRRGGPGAAGGARGRLEPFGPRGRPQDMKTSMSPGAPSPPINFPNMPPPPPGFPFDPIDPMQAIMAMQAMGMPPLPGLPPFPSMSPSGFGLQGASAPGEKGSPANAPDLAKRTGQRCKDYDEKGVCALGSTCPHDHGNDHIIVPGQDEYDPSNANIMTDATQATGASANGHGPGADRARGRGRGRGRGGIGRGGNQGAPASRRSRADFSHAGPNQDRSVTTVVVENIPEEKFNEPAVRGFFGEFGTIQDVQMQAYKRLALVKYEDWASAKRAYESPKVIFDNRFVKVYWYKPESLPTPPTNSHSGARKAASPVKTAEEVEREMEEIKKKQDALQKVHEEKMKKIKEAEESKRELERRREELLKSQAEETRKLREKLAMKGGTESAAAGGAAGGGDADGDGSKKPSSQTEALKAQLAALEAKASSMGIDYALSDDTYGGYSARGRGAPRSRGYRARGYLGRGTGGFRGASFAPRGSARGGARGGAYKLDNRTKKVAVSGVEFDEEKDEGLRQFLLGLGEYENIEPNPSRGDSQIVTFKDRFTAEKLVYGNTTDIPGIGKIELSWVNIPSSGPSMSTLSATAATAPSGSTMGGTSNGLNGDGPGDGDTAMKGASGTDAPGAKGGLGDVDDGGYGEVDGSAGRDDDEDRWMDG